MAITAENARELQLKGAHTKRQLRANRELAALHFENKTISLEYSDKQLARARLQLDKLFDKFMAESDAQELNWLATAQGRLAELERQLSNRPLPGTLRPQRESKLRTNSVPEPIPDHPGPLPPLE